MDRIRNPLLALSQITGSSSVRCQPCSLAARGPRVEPGAPGRAALTQWPRPTLSARKFNTKRVNKGLLCTVYSSVRISGLTRFSDGTSLALSRPRLTRADVGQTAGWSRKVPGFRTRDRELSKAGSAYLGWRVRHVFPTFQVPQDVDDPRHLLAVLPAAPQVPSTGLDILPCSWGSGWIRFLLFLPPLTF